VNDREVLTLWDHAQQRARATMNLNWPLVLSSLALLLACAAFALARRPAPTLQASPDYRLYNSCLAAQNHGLTFDQFMQDPNGETVNKFCAQLAHVEQPR
jgi:hypothetical protein